MEEIERNVHAEQVRLLYFNALKSVPTNVLGAALLVPALWPVVPAGQLLSWCVALGAISGARTLLARHRLTQPDFLERARGHDLAFRWELSLTGLLWSSGFLLLAPRFDAEHEAQFALFLLALGGMACAALASLGCLRAAFLHYLAPLLGPPILWCLAHTGHGRLLHGLLLLALAAVLVALSSNIARVYRSSIRRRFENDDLIRSLEEANERLSNLNQELCAARDQLLESSLSDALTGISNRRRFEHELRQEWNRCQRFGAPLAVVLIDVDHFKAYNDHYGHQAGDDCLRRVGRTLERALRRSIDLVARYGGEEFVLLLPNSTADGALRVCERVLMAFAAENIPHAASPVQDHVTVSLGVASFVPNELRCAEELLESADRALYLAKGRGRNRAEVGETLELRELSE